MIRFAQEGPATTMPVTETRTKSEKATTMGQYDPAQKHFFNCLRIPTKSPGRSEMMSPGVPT